MWLPRLAVGCACALLVGAALFRVWVYQDAVQLGYRLSEREDELRQLRNDTRQLEIELAAERSPAHLGELARALNLAPASAVTLANDKNRGAHSGRVAPPTKTKSVTTGGPHGRP